WPAAAWHQIGSDRGGAEPQERQHGGHCWRLSAARLRRREARCVGALGRSCRRAGGRDGGQRRCAAGGVVGPKIPDGPDGRAIRGWFAEAGLDPNNPDDWPRLMLILGNSRGAPRKHKDLADRLCFEASQMQMQRYSDKLPPLSTTGICLAL